MLGKADTPANEGKQEGVQAETEGDKTLGKRKDPQEGGRTIQQRETRRGTMGDKTVRKADTPSPQGTNQGYNGKHPREGVQQRETVGKANTPSNKGSQEGVQWEAQGDKTLRKADAPSNKRKQEGVQWAMGDKGKQERRGTMGDNIGDKTSGRRTHHPTPRRTP